MYILIVNPIAGNGRAKRLYERFIHDDRLNNVTLKSFFTKYDTHAEKIINEQLSKEWVKNLKAIIVFGGDGTFHDVVNGMKNYVIPVALIPGGSGNDFARGINLPKRQNNLINNILNGLNTSYSCGHYTLSSKAQRLFLNCVGFGFDAVVANYVNQSKIKNMLNKLKLGKLSYLYALLVQLFFYEPIKVSIELDGVTKKFHHCFLVTVNNQPYFGGGMKINPKAKNNPNHFSILVIDSISRWKVLLLFGTVFTGKHLKFKEVKTYTAQNIHIRTDENVLFQVDGETGMGYSCKISKKLSVIDVLGKSIEH